MRSIVIASLLRFLGWMIVANAYLLGLAVMIEYAESGGVLIEAFFWYALFLVFPLAVGIWLIGIRRPVPLQKGKTVRLFAAFSVSWLEMLKYFALFFSFCYFAAIFYQWKWNEDTKSLGYMSGGLLIAYFVFLSLTFGDYQMVSDKAVETKVLRQTHTLEWDKIEKVEVLTYFSIPRMNRTPDIYWHFRFYSKDGNETVTIGPFGISDYRLAQSVDIQKEIAAHGIPFYAADISQVDKDVYLGDYHDLKDKSLFEYFFLFTPSP